MGQSLTLLLCVHNSIYFDKVPRTTGWIEPPTMTDPPPCLRHNCGRSLLYLSPELLCSSWFEPKFSKLDVSLYKYNLACLGLFSSLPSFHGNNFLWGVSEQEIDQFNGQIHLSGSVSGLCWIFSPLFYKNTTFKYSESAVATSFVLHLSSFLNVFKDTLHTLLKYARFSANNSLQITLLVQKI